MVNRDLTQPPSLSELQELLDDGAKPIAQFLASHSYVCLGFENNNTELEASSELFFQNMEKKREVSFGLSWVENLPVLSLMIVRLPRRDIRDDLFVDLFAQKQVPVPGARDIAFDISPHIPLRSEVLRVARIYEEILRNQALAIIDGRDWVEGCISNQLNKC